MKPVHTCAALVWTTVLLFVPFDFAAAQHPGDRVRVVVAGDTLTGDVTETSDTGLTITLWSGILSGYAGEREFTYGQIETLEVRTCCQDYLGLVAVGGGVLLGLGVGNEIGKTCTEVHLLFAVSESCVSSGNNALWGGAIGGAIGLVAALTVLREGWETIQPRARGGPSVAPLVGIHHEDGRAAVILGTRVRF